MGARRLIDLILILCFVGYFAKTEASTSLTNDVHRYGLNSQYMCHCNNDEKCDVQTGTCNGGCSSGWFGPGCQIRDILTYYMYTTDIVTRHSSNIANIYKHYSNKANDGNIETCSYTNYANLSESEPWWKAWLPNTEVIKEIRILTNDIGKIYLEKYTIYVENVTNDKSIPSDSQVCYQQRVKKSQDKEIHVVCNKPLYGNQVRIQLGSTNSQLVLCDIKIYGGRNFAFRKNVAANSPSDETKYPLEKAVDGSFEADDWSNCFLSEKGTGIWFSVDLGAMVYLTHVSLTRRGSDTKKPYEIQTSFDNITWTSVYTDSGQPATLDVTGQVSTRYIRIYRPFTDAANAICELHAFGECADGYCGYDCSLKCHCKTSEDRLTGTCLAGCEGRWTGPNGTCVKECDEYTWGTDCSQKCATRGCSEPCDVVTGQCSSSCADGYIQSDMCNTECEVGTYGRDCVNNCSDSCSNGNCFKSNGTCREGCTPGFTGDMCDIKCEHGTNGLNCSNVCNVNCKSVCRKEDGYCASCESGWKGPKCETECSTGRWGPDCANTCENCLKDECNPINGNCELGCRAGYKHTEMCVEQCENGTYGLNCSNVCNDNCNSTCNKDDGSCAICLTGWKGPQCAIEYKQTSQSGSSLTAGIVGCVMAAAALVAVMLVVVYCHMKHGDSFKHKADDKTVDKGVGSTEENTIKLNSQSCSTKPLTPDVVYANTNETSKEPSTHEEYYNICSVSRRTPHAVSLSDLSTYVRRGLSNGDLVEQFEVIPYGLQQKFATTAATAPENVGKNRYNNIHPYDHCRVILKQHGSSKTCDYVNASYIQGYHKENAYIASQGPTKQTLNDFWSMIWENDVHVIAMVTNLIENTKTKCVQYWPVVNESVHYGNISVFTETENMFADFDVRRFKISQDGDLETREITHFGYTAWPDKGVPNTTTSLLQFWQRVRKNNVIKAHPLLVHCSAGVGRTGTFIALDILYEQGQDTGYVDVYQCVKDMRDQRVNMVQVKEQYQYLHWIVLDALVLPSQPVSMDEFELYYTKQLEIDEETGNEKLQLQFQSLSEILSVSEAIPIENPDSTIESYSTAKDESNRDKIRDSTILAPNVCRPFLCTPVKGTTNYINAVYMLSYSDAHGFIITQTPLPTTAVDVCRLIVEQEVQAIVTFDEGNNIDNVGKYLPDADTIELGPFAVSFVSEEDKGGYVVKKHALLYNSKVFKLTQLIYKAWTPSSPYPDNPSYMLGFRHEVDGLQRLAENKTIIAQCMNGAERSGLFVVLMNMLEYARIDGGVSIPNIIRYLRRQRPEIIPNYEQYKFCHDVFLCYTTSESTYANM